MPITVGGTQITFNDATTQSTAAIINTTNVLNATAGAGVGAVGTYAGMSQSAGGTVGPGATLAGSSLRYSGVSYIVETPGGYPVNSVSIEQNGTVPSGTWRCMGNSKLSATTFSLWLRIS
jgi:hypothetical protein